MTARVLCSLRAVEHTTKVFSEQVEATMAKQEQARQKQEAAMVDLALELRGTMADTKLQIETTADQLTERVDAGKREQHDKNEAMSLATADLKATVVENREIAQKDLEKLQQDCEDKFTKVNQRIDTDHEHFSTAYTDLDKRFVDKHILQNELIEVHHQKCTSATSALETQCAEMAASADSRFSQATEVTERHHQLHRSLCVDLEARIGNKVEAAENSVDKLRATFADGSSRLDAKAAELEERVTDFVQERVQGIEDKTMAQQTATDDRCNKLKHDIAEQAQGACIAVDVSTEAHVSTGAHTLRPRVEPVDVPLCTLFVACFILQFMRARCVADCCLLTQCWKHAGRRS